MLIRCPKCRYRFDEPVAEGITEVHSVCPLCGTPFVVAADIQEAAPIQHNEHQQTTITQEHIDEKLTDYEKSLNDIQTRNMQDRRRRGYDGIGCIVVILLLSLLMLYLCSGRDRESRADNDEQTVGLLSADSISSDSVPQWIEGNWIGIAKGDTTTLSIYGHNIALTHSDSIISGFHRIYDGKMFCSFSPDYEPVFILHPKKELIDIVLSNDQRISMMRADRHRELQQQKAIAEAERKARISARRNAILNKSGNTKKQKRYSRRRW